MRESELHLNLMYFVFISERDFLLSYKLTWAVVWCV